MMPHEYANNARPTTLSGNFTGHSLGISLSTKVSQIDARTVPQIAASPATVTPGRPVTVTGASFNVQASIFLDHVAGTPLATASRSRRAGAQDPMS